jgi:hypothetical protein
MEIAAHAGPGFDGEAAYIAYSDRLVAAYDGKDRAERRGRFPIERVPYLPLRAS